MIRLSSCSPEQTRELGARLSRQLRTGDVLALMGDLGAGKSEFTRGLARGLGDMGYITSPTFTILQVHDAGRLPLYHFDWYRVESAEELYELSMDEYLYGDGVAVVEWPQMAWEVMPESYLRVEITALGETQRQITLTQEGGFHELDASALQGNEEASK